MRCPREHQVGAILIEIVLLVEVVISRVAHSQYI